MKTCVTCGKSKSLSEFRKDGRWYRNKCLECNRAYGRERERERRKNPEVMAHYREVGKEYYRKHLDERKEVSRKQWHEKKRDAEYRLKRWLSLQNRKNSPEYMEKLRANVRKHRKKITEGVTDSYVACRLMVQYGLTRKEALANKDAIDFKRSEILLHRLKKSLRNGYKAK